MQVHGGMARGGFPAKLSKEATEKVQQQALLAFKALKLRGYARIDFRLTTEGEFYCLEANTLPGMTELSLIHTGRGGNGNQLSRVVRANRRGSLWHKQEARSVEPGTLRQALGFRM